MPHFPSGSTFIRTLLLSASACLAACGGGEEPTSPATSDPPPVVDSPPPASDPPPPVAPPTPTHVSAAGQNAAVLLTWTGNASAASYRVKRSTSNGGPFTQVASVTTLQHLDTNVTNGTKYFYVVTAANPAGESAQSAIAAATPSAPAQPDPPGNPPPTATVTVTVNPAQTRPISPFIYGVNIAGAKDLYPTASGSGLPADLTLNRGGGNRLTAYNWETNHSNAGSDYYYQNDDLISSSTVAGAGIRDSIAQDRAAGMASMITVQMQGLVAGDKNGPVSVASPPDMSRFKTVVFKKSSMSASPFTLTPPTNDAYVYMDEFVWALDQRFAGQSIFGANPASQPVLIQLDNEPDLWNHTHLEIQGPNAMPAATYINRTIGLTSALKDQFPDATLIGPAHYGFLGLYSWQGELAATPSGGNWFVDQYLSAMKTASDNYGRRLVDVYDFHWYSEATDGSGNRVTSLNGSSLTAAQVQAIVQSPRSLWDPTFQENSWISSVLGGPIQILPRLQAKVAAKNPGTKLAITEYHNGGGRHIAGTIAQADNLGVFGAQGLYAATHWPLIADQPYVMAGFRAFRNFDGVHSHFGDVSVQSTSSDPSKVMVYVSTDSTRAGRVVMVAINRSTSEQVVAVTGQPLSGMARLFRMSASTASGQTTVTPVAAGSQPASGSSLTVTLPALSVTTIDIY